MTNSKKVNERHSHNHSYEVSEMSGMRILITVLLNLFITVAEL